MTPKKQSWLQITLLVMALAGFYVAYGFLRRPLPVLSDTDSILWPPAGVALAALLLFGYRIWPGILLGVAGYAWVERMNPGFAMAGLVLGSTIGPVFGAFFLKQVTEFHNGMGRLRDVGVFLILACGLGAAFGALFYSVGRAYDGLIAWEALYSDMLEWWVPNALAYLVVTPAILIWSTPCSRQWSTWRILEATVCSTALVVSSFISFHTWFSYGIQNYPMAYLPVPFMLWSSFRCGPRGAATGVLLVTSVAVYSFWDGFGPFIDVHEADGLRLMGSYIGMVALTNLFLAAAINERRRSEEAATENERRLRAMAEEQPDLICRFEEDGKLIFANPAYCRFYGKDAEELLGTNFFQTVTHREAATLRDSLDILPDDKPVLAFDRSVETRDGRTDWQQVTIHRLASVPGEKTEYQVVIQNITARKKAELSLQETKRRLEAANQKLELAVKDSLTMAERANQASAAKSDFLAMMSHEIRTPLGGVLGMLELLGQTPMSTYQRDIANAAAESANSLLPIINDILDFSKIEAGRIEFSREEFSLRAVMDSVMEIAARRDSKKKLMMTAIIRRETPHRLVGDPTRLRQILLNLVSNAVKFTERGEVVTRIYPLIHGQGKATLRFEVTDTGIGMSEKQIKSLFQPFTQVDNSSSRRFGGTGLGLAICRKLIDLMEGKIGVQSTPGVGSTFWFELPFEIPPQPVVPRNFPGLVFINAIIAAPNASLRESLTEQLQSWGVACRAVATPAELFRLARHDLRDSILPILIFDDDILAQADNELRQLLKDNKGRIHGILLTSPESDVSRNNADFSDLSSWLLKPFKEQLLFDKLINIVARKSPESLQPVKLPGDTQFINRKAVAPARTPVSGLRILVAEDHPFNRKVCQLMLETFAAKADWAVNGREAVELAAKNNYDAIFMDCNMPEMDGIEATVAIRHLEIQAGSTHRARIIALTANALTGDRERHIEAGMDDYLTKPFTAQQLYHALLVAVPPAVGEELGFDVTRMEQLFNDIDRIVAMDMADDFLDEFPERMADIRRLTEDKRWPELERAAHTLKGLCSMFGLHSLSQSFSTMEEAAASADSAQVQTALTTAINQAGNHTTRLRDWLQLQRANINL